MWKKLFQVLLGTSNQNSNAFMIAKHLSRNVLYERKGIDTLYPDLKDKTELLIKRMSDLGKPIRVFEAFRSAKKQDGYYKKVPKITNAEGLQSYHQYGLAVDLVFEEHKWTPPLGWWNTLGNEGMKLGLTWGGAWGDNPHFEWHPKFTWKKLSPHFS